jgi:hypothetical protein
MIVFRGEVLIRCRSIVEILVLGTGMDHQMPNPELLKWFRSHHIGLEIMTTVRFSSASWSSLINFVCRLELWVRSTC